MDNFENKVLLSTQQNKTLPNDNCGFILSEISQSPPLRSLSTETGEDIPLQRQGEDIPPTETGEDIPPLQRQARISPLQRQARISLHFYVPVQGRFCLWGHTCSLDRGSNSDTPVQYSFFPESVSGLSLLNDLLC